MFIILVSGFIFSREDGQSQQSPYTVQHGPSKLFVPDLETKLPTRARTPWHIVEFLPEDVVSCWFLGYILASLLPYLTMHLVGVVLEPKKMYSQTVPMSFKMTMVLCVFLAVSCNFFRLRSDPS